MISYGYNAFSESYGEVNGVSGSQTIGIYSNVSDATVQFPAQTIEAGDGVCPRWRGKDHVDNFNRHVKAYVPHNDGANFVFIDGHVKWQSNVKYCEFDVTRSADY